MPTFNNLPPAPTPPLHHSEFWSRQQSSRAGLKDELPYSRYTQGRTPYQHASRVGLAAYSTSYMHASLPETRKQSDPFFVSIDKIVDEHLYEKEHTAEAEGIKSVKFQEVDT